MKVLVILAAIFVLASSAAGAGDRVTLEDELDTFAADHLDKVQVRSFKHGVEYCGLFGIDRTGRLVATDARRGLADSCEPPYAPASWSEVLASYHTHGVYEAPSQSEDDAPDTEVPSLNDLEADIDEGIDGYVATPGGRLWFNDIEEEIAYQLCGLGCLTADPKFRECAGDRPREDYTLDDLAEREDTLPAEC